MLYKKFRIPMLKRIVKFLTRAYGMVSSENEVELVFDKTSIK